MTFLKKYWWIFILVFFLFSFKKKEEETEEESNILKIGEHSNRVLRLQKWLNVWLGPNGYDKIIVDGKYGIETATALRQLLFTQYNNKYWDAVDKYFDTIDVNTKSWIDWIDLDWLSSEYGFN
jgi:hypothetical protein